MIFLFGLNFQKISYTYHCGWVRWIGEGWENFSFHYPLEVKFGFGRIFLRFLFSTLLWRLEMRFDESPFPITHLDTISHFGRKILKYFFPTTHRTWEVRLGEKSQNFSEIILSLSYRGWFFCLTYFFKYFLHSPLRMKTAFLRKKRKSFEKNIFPLSDGREMLKQSIGWINFFVSTILLRKRKLFWRRYLKNISTFPTGHENPIWPNFFEKIKIFISLYLSGKNVNPHQCICRCHQKDKNDKVYQGQIPKVLLGKNSIKIHKKKFKNWPWYTLHTAAWVNLDEPLLPKVLLGDFFKNLLRESLYNDLNRG